MDDFGLFSNSSLKVFFCRNFTLIDYFQARVFDRFLNLTGFLSKIELRHSSVPFGHAICWYIVVIKHERRRVKENDIGVFSIPLEFIRFSSTLAHFS